MVHFLSCSFIWNFNIMQIAACSTFSTCSVPLSFNPTSKPSCNNDVNYSMFILRPSQRLSFPIPISWSFTAPSHWALIVLHENTRKYMSTRLKFWTNSCSFKRFNWVWKYVAVDLCRKVIRRQFENKKEAKKRKKADRWLVKKKYRYTDNSYTVETKLENGINAANAHDLCDESETAILLLKTSQK